MKRLYVLSFCSLTASCLVLALLSPALLAQPAEDFAGRLRDAFERHGWEMQQAPDGSLMYYPPQRPARNQASTERLRQALERQGWRMETGPDGSLIYWPPRIETPVTQRPATAQPGAAHKPGEAREQPGPQTKPATAVREEIPVVVEKPATPPSTEEAPAAVKKPVTPPSTEEAPAAVKKPVTPPSTAAPVTRPPEAKMKSAVDKKTASPQGAAPRTPMPEQRRRAPQRSGYYYDGYPRYRPVPPARYRSPPEGYRSARPPCPYGPWDCGRPAGRRPGSQAPAWRK